MGSLRRCFLSMFSETKGLSITKDTKCRTTDIMFSHVIWQIFMFNSFFFQPQLPSFVYTNRINTFIFFTLTSTYHFIISCIRYSGVHCSTILVTFFPHEKSFRLTFGTYITTLALETYMLHNTTTLIFI